MKMATRLFCPLCGMLRDNCICNQLEPTNETKVPTIVLCSISVKGGFKKRTRISFRVADGAQLEKLVPILTSKLNCGGTCDGNDIILQGDQEKNLFEQQLLPNMLLNLQLLK